MNLYLTFMVILVTVGVAFWLGWVANRGAAELDRMRLLDQLDQATANVQVRRIAAPGAAGPQHLSPALNDGTAASPIHQPIKQPFAGALDTSYEIRSPSPIVPWDLAGAAYVLGQVNADRDEVSRQVDAIFAEVEFDPKWRYR